MEISKTFKVLDYELEESLRFAEVNAELNENFEKRNINFYKKP